MVRLVLLKHVWLQVGRLLLCAPRSSPFKMCLISLMITRHKLVIGPSPEIVPVIPFLLVWGGADKRGEDSHFQTFQHYLVDEHCNPPGTVKANGHHGDEPLVSA